MFGLKTSVVFSQNNSTIDSIIASHQNKPNEEVIEILWEDSRSFLNTNSNLSVLISEKALEIAKTIKNPKKLSKTYLLLSQSLYYNQKLEKALQHTDSALFLAKSLKEDNLIAKIKHRKGLIYFGKTDYLYSLENLNASLKTKDSVFLAKCYSDIATIYAHLGNYNAASGFYHKSIKLHERNENFEGVADAGLNLANVYMRYQDYRSALNLQFAALKYYKQNSLKTDIAASYSNIGATYVGINELDSAIFFLKKSIEINKEIDEKRVLIVNYINISTVYSKTEKISLALQYIEQAKELSKNTNNKYTIAECALVEASIYKENNQLNKAIKIANNALKIAIKINALELTQLLNELLYQIYEDKNDLITSFRYFKIHTELKDSIFSIEKTTAIENLKISYETEKKEQEIKILKEENKYRRFVQQTLTIAIILAIILISIIYYTLKLRIKNARQNLRISTSEKQRQKLELEKKDLENDNLKKDLEIKHKELTSSAINLIKTGELNTKLMKELKDLVPKVEPKYRNDIKKIMRIYQMTTQDKSWEEFELRFEQVHKRFYLKLSENFPELTPNERKLCAFLRLNMTTKDIALITFKTVNSINQARKRLRKKLNLEQETNLIKFLVKL